MASSDSVQSDDVVYLLLEEELSQEIIYTADSVLADLEEGANRVIPCVHLLPDQHISANSHAVEEPEEASISLVAVYVSGMLRGNANPKWKTWVCSIQMFGGEIDDESFAALQARLKCLSAS